MTAEHTNPPDDRERFSAVLLACLEAMDNGQPLPREELLARHPEFAADLGKFLEDQERVDRCVAPLRAAVALPSPLPGPDLAELGAGTEPLGDFRIVRELGRGGMGVVYEAEQLSLGRRVALKVLPFASTLDARQLQRFKNEAQAAALHHTNIVPVFATGCERGVHYYAMQFIDGHTVAALIDELRRPARPPAPAVEPTGPYPPDGVATPPAAALSTERTAPTPAHFRTAARLGAQAAEALEHAHQIGIVHRDIKPGNLLVDVRGNLWVTDFGLAHYQGQAGLTMTGDLVGTLRYMSPEQALAKRVVVDHRTDVYSLGVTLYELLTLEPAFAGSDREELLRQIAFEEARPPRGLNKTIPGELETIVLKAMEKNSADRYSTAQELADDLERYLKDEPIRARRPSLLQRVRRWGRRHPAVVWSAAVGVVVALVVLGGCIGWILQDQRRGRQLADQEAQAAREDLGQLRREGKWAAALAVTKRVETLLVRVGGDLELRRQFTELSRDLQLAAQLEEIRLRRSAVKDGGFDFERSDGEYAAAFRTYGIDVETLEPAVAAERIRARTIREELAAYLDDWATIPDVRDNRRVSRLLAVARAADPDPYRNRVREALARGDGKALRGLAEEAEEAEELNLPPSTVLFLAEALAEPSARWEPTPAGSSPAERAVGLLRRAQQQYPDDFWLNQNLGWYLRYRQPPLLDEAIGFFRTSVALRSGSPGAHLNLGYALHDRGDFRGAIAAYHKAIDLKPDYAEAYSNLGGSLDATGDRPGAIRATRKAIDFNPRLFLAHSNLGSYLFRQGNLTGAIAALRKAIALKPEFFKAQANLGVALHDTGELAGAIAAHRKAIALKPDSAETHNNLGNSLTAQGDPAGASSAYRKAIALKPDYIEAHYNLGIALNAQANVAGAIAAYRKAIALKPDFAAAHHNLGIVLQVAGDRPGAIAHYQKAIALQPDLADAHLNLGFALFQKGELAGSIVALRKAIALKPDLTAAHYQLGRALYAIRDLAGAVTAFRQAIELKPEFAEAHCDLGHTLRELAEFRKALAALRRGDELGKKQRNWPNPSAQWVRNCERLVELDERLPTILAGKTNPASAAEQIELARLCLLKRLNLAAARFYEGAFAAQPELTGPRTLHNYNAACAAALAGCGQGEDAAGLDETQRASWRRKALVWLRAELEARRYLLKKESEKIRLVLVNQMRGWLANPNFAGVRGPQALAKLPGAERQPWQQLWGDVASTLARAQAKTTPMKPSNVK
jgi:tetratricopeptide (TPR) repeat protein/serine/threonine protein kinase